MGGSIPISTKHGVNPSVCICTNCGKDTGELILPGRISKFKCRCGKEIYGRRQGVRGYKFDSDTKQETCSCGEKAINWDLIEKDVEMPRQIPYGVCDACKKMFEEHKAIVTAGGIYWQCKDCGSNGVIKGSSELSKAVRKQSKIAPPNPVGIKFDKEHNCPVCSKKE